MAQKLTLLRLQKETAELQRNPLENAFVARVGNLKFHFCLHSLHPPYKGGYYHGLLELHENYPFKAPKLYFYTPSGRFEINVPICTSFTHYHQETWTSAWNVRTLIVATISFMYSQEPSFGCKNESQSIRKSLAALSKKHNMRNEEFRTLFGEKIAELERSRGVSNLNNSNSSGEEMKNQQLMQDNVGEQIEPAVIQLANAHPLPRNRRERYKVVGIVLLVIILLLFIN